jgi:hypothetical protein
VRTRSTLQPIMSRSIQLNRANTSTYGHSQLKTGHPVRSAIHEQLNGRLVLRWVSFGGRLLIVNLVVKRLVGACTSRIFINAAAFFSITELVRGGPSSTFSKISMSNVCLKPSRLFLSEGLVMAVPRFCFAPDDSGSSTMRSTPSMDKLPRAVILECFR